MALTIVVLASEAEGSELSITLDAPRIVIGRGDGCEVRLPDPSVSQRHASVRQRGAEYTLVDEGSLNGTWLGRRQLAPRTPEPLRDGDRVRVGRVWLEIRIGPALPLSASPATAARELALALVARGLLAQGEDPTPRIHVIAGPDEGRAIALAEPGRPYTLGRSADADLPLEDRAAGRRHLALTRKGDLLTARDVSGAGGTTLDGAPLPPGADVACRPGQVLAFGATQVIYEHPASEALAELERCPEEPVRAADVPDPPGGVEPAASPAPPSDAAPDEASPGPAAVVAPPPVRRQAPASQPSRTGWGFTDAAVVLLALGVLAVSIAGLTWLLKP